LRAASSVQAEPFNWFEAITTGSGKPKASQTGVASIAAPAPLIELRSEASAATAKIKRKWSGELMGNLLSRRKNECSPRRRKGLKEFQKQRHQKKT